jgi:carbon monoxide dehydrogenase subunit G
MKFNQSFVVEHHRERVWKYLGNPVEVAKCMPGATAESSDGGDVRFTLNAKLGPISTSFAGSATVEREDADFRGAIRGSGRDKRSNSRAKGEVQYRLLEEEGEGTRVDIEVDYSIAGSLAQFSRGAIVNDLAKRLTEEFAKNLQAALDRLLESGVASENESVSVERVASQDNAAPLNAGQLLLSVIWARIKTYFASVFSRP